VSQLLRAAREQLLPDSASATGTNRAPPPHAFPPGELESIESKLAFHVGPMARYLVKNAAATASTRNELTLRLAGEIELAAARQKFIESCSRE
jgi:eukaryotic-like serine/threonine-protein kinase